MAQLKDTVVAGSLRVTDTTYTTNLNIATLTASKALVADANKNIVTEDLTVSAPSASGNATAFITSVSQGATGKISVSKSNLDTSGTWSGTATKATTTADTSNSLYLVGVVSGATSTLKHTTGATVKNGAISATTYNDLTLTAAATGFTIKGGTTAKTLTVGADYTLGAACAYAVDDATANGALGTGTGLTTERSVYYGLVTVNNASQTRATGIYAPTSAGTANQILVSAGGTSAPSWLATAAGAAYATGANGALTFGTLSVGYGGTGLTTSTYKNAIVTGNTSTATNAFTTVRTGSGAFYATAQDGAATFGTLPVAQGGTGVTTVNKNTIFAGNATTDAQAPSFRKLVAADIPVLDLPLAVTYTLAENAWKQFIVQTDNKLPFSGSIRLRTYNSSNTAINQQIDLHFISRNNTIIIYGVDSTRTTWSGNSGVYQIRAYTTKEDGNNSTYTSYKGGVDLLINSTTTRTIEIYALELKNCTINSSLIASTYNSTYHNLNTQSTCSNRHFGVGLQGGADTASWSYGSSEPNGYRTNGATIPLTGYGLYGIDENGLAQGISIRVSGQTANSVDISTTRVYNTHGFDWQKGIFYTNSSTWFAVNASMNITCSTKYYVVDLRYSDNCLYNNSTATTLGMEPRKPVYLRGYIKEDNLFYLAPITVTYSSASYQRAWTQTVPTTEETITVSSTNYPIVYMYLGFPYYDTAYSNYRLSLAEYNPVYWYKDSKFRKYNDISMTQGGILHATSATTYGCTAAGTAGQLIISNGTSAPSWTDGMTYTASTSTATKVRYLTGGAWELYSQEAENGYTELRLGNNIASGSQYSSYASLKMYNKSSGYHYIEASDTNTGYFTHTLPSNSGILVTTNGTPSAAIGSSTKPVYVSANGVITEGGDLSRLIIIKTYNYTISSISKNAVVAVSATNLGASTPSGYTFAGFTEIYTTGTGAGDYVGIHTFAPVGAPAASVRIYNHSDAAKSNIVVYVRALYIKSGYMALNPTS